MGPAGTSCQRTVLWPCGRRHQARPQVRGLPAGVCDGGQTLGLLEGLGGGVRETKIEMQTQREERETECQGSA